MSVLGQGVLALQPIQLRPSGQARCATTRARRPSSRGATITTASSGETYATSANMLGLAAVVQPACKISTCSEQSPQGRPQAARGGFGDGARQMADCGGE